MTKEIKIGVVSSCVSDFRIYVKDAFDRMPNGSVITLSPTLNPNTITLTMPNGEKTKYFLIQYIEDALAIEIDGAFICENIAGKGEWSNLYELAKQRIR